MKREKFDTILKDWTETRNSIERSPQSEHKDAREELAWFLSWLDAEGIIDEGSKGTKYVADMLMGGVKGFKDYTMEELADEAFSLYCDENGDGWFLEDLIKMYSI